MLFHFDRFNMVSYSPQSRRLAVGAKNGQLALYDLRSSRCQASLVVCCFILLIFHMGTTTLFRTFSHPSLSFK